MISDATFLSDARISGTINVSQDQESIRLQLYSVKIRIGNPINLPDQPIFLIGSYFSETEFDILSLIDVKPFTSNASLIRNIKKNEFYIFGDLKTTKGQSEISAYNLFIEAANESQYQTLINSNGMSAVIEGRITKFIFENGEEVGLLVSKITL